ncbi:Asp-tRNA(Asn)/Glu-tRNA(Gln) amidotransferase subunit GatA [Patescibacteria group bacterium]|nr:Asp-tRNA(Asn)/Glu-tRNA(Gln) amidotransferase subunit GatA [Patescibacteria group bacterium]MBU1890319.1 Asp-tRNA(Asn)/Glu-tRNA(Gln) amidotransferase subunit GatA [Patescibacteria group bacterium]
MELTRLTLKEANQGLSTKQFSCRELIQASIDRINSTDSKINAIITKTDSNALDQADKLDQLIMKGHKPTALEGVPVGLKDNLVTQGIKTTAGSKILEPYVPPYTATAVEKLNKAGAITIGKTNCDEFGMGASGENSSYKPTKNPWDLKRVPGGSSSGSAAAVSSGQCLFALGTDTGGSVRQPASFCNLVGLKPTYGRISRYGVIALASSLDQVGVLSRTVDDAAAILQCIAGHDKKDSTSLRKAVPNYTKEITDVSPKLKIGVPKEFFIDGMDKGVEELIKDVIQFYSDSGHEVTEISLPHTAEALAVYYLILTAEASSNLARYDGVRFGLSRDDKAKSLIDFYRQTRAAGFGPEVKRRIMLGTYALSSGYYEAYYLKAQKVRTLIIDDYQKAFKKVDCLITPTAPTPAFKLGEKYEDPLTMYLSDIFTVSANIAGLPAISVPAGLSQGLPVGMQIMGQHYQELQILQLAHLYQQKTKWQKQYPKL